jgi:beta-N-acetylhexosaminidase
MTLSLERRIGRMCIVGFEGVTAPDYLLDWLRAGRVGGIILFSRNIASVEQVIALTDSLRAAAPDELLIGIDQEGGAVARMRAEHGFTEVPGAMALASSADGVRHAEAVYAVLGAELRAVGIDWDYAPCVDLAYNRDNPSLGTRSFGRDAARVGVLAGAAVRGLQAAPHQVAACGKHFPGLGDTAIDTHLALPTVTASIEQLRDVDMQPYHSIIRAGVASIMVTHTMFAALDDRLPATLSPFVVSRLLRGELSYDGAVCTDCMEMKAIADNFGAGESAVLAALAGIDAILFSHTPAMQAEAYEALLAAARSGRLPEALIDDANRRMDALRAFAVQPRGDAAVVRSEAHRQTALEAARAAISIVPADADLFAGRAEKRTTAVIEFPSLLESGIVEAGGVTGFARAAADRLPGAHVHIWRTGAEPDTAAFDLARRADLLVIGTRSAHLNTRQADHARALIDAAPGRVIVVALRNPYDAPLFIGLDKVNAVICTCGDAEPSLIAAAESLSGAIVPSGIPPVV